MGVGGINWTTEAVDKLKEYHARTLARENIHLELARLEEEFSAIRTGNFQAIPASGGEGKREDRLLSNIVQRGELQRALSFLDEWLRVVDAGLQELEPQERLVLEEMYIVGKKGGVERLCEKLNILNPAGVYKRKDKALRHFTLALYGVGEL